MFVITEMYHVFLGHWRRYAEQARGTHPEWFPRGDERAKRFARALDELERNRGDRFPELQARLLDLMTEMQTFMREHPDEAILP